MLKKNIPYSKGLPVLGNFFAYKKDRLKMLEDHRTKYGDIFKIKVGPKNLIVINKPEYIGHVMMKNMKNYIKKTNFEVLFGQSIFIANGNNWKKQRNMLQPLFSVKYLKSCIDDVQNSSDTNIQKYFKENNDGRDIRQLFTKITFDVIMKSVIGLDYTDAYEMIDDALFTITHHLTNDSYSLFPLPEFLDSEKKKFNIAMKNLDDVVYGSIEKAKSNPNGESFVHLMLNAAKDQTELNVDDEFIRNNVVTMTFAGYETSALTLTWLTYCLSLNTKWQDKCIEEAKNFNLSDISLDSLKTIPNIEACIFEAMRLYPAGWAFTRFCQEDDVIDGYEIKANDIILLSAFLTHRDPKLWEDADVFKPERFLGKSIFDYGKFQYFPFGAGPRVCMGMHLGMMEMKVIMLNLFKEYKCELQGEHPILDARATIFSKNGYQVLLEKL